MRNLILIGLALWCSCSKVDVLRDVPTCIESKIKDFTKCDEGAEVSEYTFQTETLFTFYQGSCGADQGTEVYNPECEFVGYLGGIANLKEINGEDFYSNATLEGKVWGN